MQYNCGAILNKYGIIETVSVTILTDLLRVIANLSNWPIEM